ncbi:MAG: hypothetical protein IPO85_04730 [Saprospiraceae bacterium]|uniref:Uncharacterized protein n=1 Tax=Candidatus Defluviibacterium haderslevense TaxID=2981993 RepID=A0A9D7S7Z9_9BACT|nr:hypothetical protein [Candidatus Defluviibacterium haderslevense]
MTFHDIAAVQLIHRNEWIMFSRIDIESRGGEQITVSGLKTEDAKELKFLLDHLR